MSAQRERGGRRALSHLTRGLVAGVVTVLIGLSAVTASASTAALRAATTGDPEGLSLALVAAPASSGIVRSGEPVSVRVTMSNTGEVPTGSIALALSIDGGTDADAARLTAWFADEPVAADELTVADATLSSLEPGASAVLDLIVPVADDALSGDFGARLVNVRATIDGAEIATDRSAVVWVPAATEPPAAGMTFVAALATPGEEAALLTAADLERYTGDAGALTRTLDAVAGRPVLLAIDPRIIASIRVLGAQAPTSAIVFLARLEAAPNESFLLPWADADPFATIAAAGTPLPRPEGVGTPTATAIESTASPSPSPDPGQPLSIDELTAWSTDFDAVAWAEAGAVTPTGLPVLAEQGTQLLLAPGSSLEHAAPVQRADEVGVLRVDDALSAAARDASLAVSQQQFDQALARVSALLAASAAGEPGIPAIIALSRDRLAGRDRLIDTIAQTIALPWTTAATASDALRREPVDAVVIEPPVDESRHDAVRSALAAEAADRIFATIAVSPQAITDVRRLDLLAALSLGWGDRSSAALQGFVVDSADLRSSVQVVESSAITLLADRASLPVTVQNGLAVPVRVFVRVDPDSAQLRVLDSRVETLVEPLSQTRALVPVESLTNGQVDITVTVRDGESRIVGSSTRVSLNLQAGWETAGTIAVAAALLVLLVVGITRDIRKRRRRAREEQAL